MRNFIFAIPLIIPAAFGGFLLFAPMKKLVQALSRMPLPMPKEKSFGYRALEIFWRGIGAVAWLFVLGAIYMLFIAH